MFEVNEESVKLPEKDRAIFHSILAKDMFVSKWVRPDILVVLSYLNMRVSKNDEDDWKKLKRLLQYIRGTINLTMTMSADYVSTVK